jgi:integrase/recombinase XerD
LDADKVVHQLALDRTRFIAFVTDQCFSMAHRSFVASLSLFAAMDDEERIRYKFFLGSGCRDKEVTFAVWSDIDFDKKTYHVRRKEDVHFTPKSHESRTIPLPDSVIALLNSRRKNAPHERWIFINEEGRPDNHFLRKLKRIAKRAGLNCGQCRTVITEGRYEKRKKINVSCKDRPVCGHFYLHRFRKTCATRWHEAGVPIRTIQNWLGHKSLETTMIYLENSFKSPECASG